MVDIDAEIRFDDGAAADAVAVIRSAIQSVNETLKWRRLDADSLQYSWEGYAERWFEARNAGLELVSVATVEQLADLASQIESQREHARRDRAQQQMMRLARAEAQRRAAEAEAARLEADRQRAAAERAPAETDVDRAGDQP